MADYETELEIAATPEEVFRYLTHADSLVEWMGQSATLEPERDGRFEVDVNGVPIRGRFVEVEPPHRVVVSWGAEGNDVLPPGSTRVEFTLTPTSTGTQLRLVHSQLPPDEAAKHAEGWTHFLERLRVVASGGDPGRDGWLPT
ncbi:MAG: SRPBCC family protein [Actinomycetota bacterium]